MSLSELSEKSTKSEKSEKSAMTIPSPHALRRLAGAAFGALALLVTQAALAAIPIEHWTASTGAQVFYVHSPSIPMLDVNVDFDAGSRYDLPGKAGLATLAAALLDKARPRATASRRATRPRSPMRLPTPEPSSAARLAATVAASACAR